MIQKLATDPEGGKPQVLPIFEFVKNIMENNNLIPVWNELPEIKKLLKLKNPKEESKGDQVYDEIKLFEKAGKLKFILKQRKFFLEADVTVPEEYPSRKPEIKFVDHNYDKNFAKIFLAGAE